MGNIFKSIGSALGSVGKSMAGPLVGAVGSILGSSINSSANVKAQREANAANMELAKYKYEKDLEMWNLQNEYNTPSAQMARFAAAGLNPNFMYGQGTAGNATSSPSFEAPNIEAYTNRDFGIGAAASGGVDIYQRQLQIDYAKRLQDSQIAKYNAEAAGQLTKNAGYLIDNTIKGYNAGILGKYGMQQAEANLVQTIATANNLTSQSNVNNARVGEISAHIGLINKQIEHEGVKMGLTSAQIKSTQAITAKYYQEIRESVQRIENLKVQYDLARQQYDSNPSPAVKKREEELRIKYENEKKEAEILYQEMINRLTRTYGSSEKVINLARRLIPLPGM